MDSKKKTSKNPKFSKVSKTSHDRFFKKKEKKIKDEEDSAEEVTNEQLEEVLHPNEAFLNHLEENLAEIAELGGLYTLVDPIETIVGPIGRFPMVQENFPLHPSVCLFGQRRTGKTYTLRYIMYNCFRHIPFGIVLTQTAENGFWQKYIPEKFVVSDLRNDWMDALLARQKKLIGQWKKEHKAEVEKDPDCYKKVPELAAFIILDDVISDRVAVLWNKDLIKFFVNGRHYCISVFITTQYPKGVGPLIRGNMDIVVLQPDYKKTSRDVYYDLYGGTMGRAVFDVFLNDVMLDKILPGSTPLECKKEVRTLVAAPYENSQNPQLTFHYNEAEDPGEFRLLAPEYWQETGPDALGNTSGTINRDPLAQLDQIVQERNKFGGF